MILLKIYNDDKIRKWNNFPSMKDPFVLENTLLRILNELFISINLPIEKSFDIYNPKFYNLYLTYFTSSNFNSWGQLPLGYIYNDMIRLIQNQNSTNNFIMTLESIEISDNMQFVKMYSINDDSPDMSGELVSAYILENYMLSYRYIKNHNNGVLVIRIPYQDRCIVYIISVGFNSYENANWFGAEYGSLPINRYRSLESIAKIKYDLSSFRSENKVIFEASDGKIKSSLETCRKIVSSYELIGLKKKSEYDTEIKYGNYPINYNWLNIYDNAIPGVMFLYDGKDSKSLINKFNQDSNSRFDYMLLKKENELIKTDEKVNYFEKEIK